MERPPRDRRIVELPASTPWPLVSALGVALTFGGMATSAVVSAAGGVLAVLGVAGWFRDVFPHEAHVEVPVSEVPARVAALEAQRRQLEKELGEAKRQLAMGGGGGAAAAGPEEIGGVQVLARVMDGVGRTASGTRSTSSPRASSVRS